MKYDEPRMTIMMWESTDVITLSGQDELDPLKENGKQGDWI